MTDASRDTRLPVGPPVPDWTPPPHPPAEPLDGRRCRLEPLDPERHAADLFAAFEVDGHRGRWTYLPYGPFDDFLTFQAWMRTSCVDDDPQFFTILDRPSGREMRPAGVTSYLRIAPNAGSIEVGHIHLGARLQRSVAATEAMYLMMRRAFTLGYRRYEWKCDALNAASRAAAQRLGFSFEGVFRQATVYKGRNRDTAWYAVIDKEWSALREAFERWLAPSNFDAEGRQRIRLSSLTSPLLFRRG